MTIQADKLLKEGNEAQSVWQTTLGAVDSEAKEQPGRVRWTFDPVFGRRGFQYLRCDQSGGVSAGGLQKRIGLVDIANITSGTTTSIVPSAALPDNKYVGGLLYCIDDAGGAGAAPEGEIGVITKQGTLLVEIDPNDAFSAATAANDDFKIFYPWAVSNAASGDTAYEVAGVAMATLPQYYWGWFQFFGLHPSVNAIAAGTAIPAGEAVVADAAIVTEGAAAVATHLHIGITKIGLKTDTVLRKVAVELFCGVAARNAVST